MLSHFTYAMLTRRKSSATLDCKRWFGVSSEQEALSDLKQKPLPQQRIEELWPGNTVWSAVIQFARAIEKEHGIVESKDLSGLQTDVLNAK